MDLGIDRARVSNPHKKGHKVKICKKNKKNHHCGVTIISQTSRDEKAMVLSGVYEK
jgi:hypothetical protein